MLMDTKCIYANHLPKCKVQMLLSGRFAAKEPNSLCAGESAEPEVPGILPLSLPQDPTAVSGANSTLLKVMNHSH